MKGVDLKRIIDYHVPAVLFRNFFPAGVGIRSTAGASPVNSLMGFGHEVVVQLQIRRRPRDEGLPFFFFFFSPGK
jgi:hypothetical protein